MSELFIKEFTKEDEGKFYWHRVANLPMLLVKHRLKRPWWKFWKIGSESYDKRGLLRFLAHKDQISHAWLYPHEFEKYNNQKGRKGVGFDAE